MADSSSPYRLTPPDRRAYDPTHLEIAYAQALSHPNQTNPGAFLGSMFEAQTNAQNAETNYNRQLGAVNAQQYNLALQRMAQDQREKEMELTGRLAEHPRHAGMFTHGYNLIRPEQRDRAQELSNADLTRIRSEAFENFGQGANSFDQAGVRAPTGAVYGATGEPTSPMVQGESRDIRKEQISGAYSLAAARAKGAADNDAMSPANLLRLSELQFKMNQAVSGAREQAYRGELARFGITYDGNNNVVVPPGVNYDDAVNRANAAGERAAGQMAQTFEGVRHTLRAGNRERFLPSQNPFAPPTQANPGGDNTPTVGNAGGPAVAAGGTNQRAAVAPPATPGPGAAPGARNAGPEQSPAAVELRSALLDMKIPDADMQTRRAQAERVRVGGRGYIVNGDGSVTIVDAKQKPIGLVPAPARPQ